MSEDEPGQLGEDAGEVCRCRRDAVSVEGDEADASFDDQGVPTSSDHVAETHPSDRVGSEARLHPDLGRNARKVDC